MDVTNTLAPGETSVSVEKVWSDDNDRDGLRPNFVTIRLLADGEEVGSTDVKMMNASRLTPLATFLADADSGWDFYFTDLPRYRDGGQEIIYTISEDPVTGYTGDITGDAADGFTVTNTHTPETIELSGKKVWDDAGNQDGVRPNSVRVSLLADGEEIAETMVDEDDTNWNADENTWEWNFFRNSLTNGDADQVVLYGKPDDDVYAGCWR